MMKFTAALSLVTLCLPALAQVPSESAPADAPPTDAPPAASAEVPAAKLVAVLDLVTQQKAAAPLANALAAVTASEVASRPGFKAVSRNELKAILSQKAEAALLGCSTAACAADVAALVEAQLVVTGSLERIEGGEAGPGGVAHVLSLSLIDPTTPAVIGRADAMWRSDPEEMVTVIRPLLDRLFDGAKSAEYQGALDVIAPEGAAIFVDGKERATAPLKSALEGLAIGVHTLELSREGYLPVRKDIVVARGEKTVVRVEMEEVPVTQTWWFWTAVGGGAAVIVAAGATIGTVAVLASLEPPPTSVVVKTPLPTAAP